MIDKNTVILVVDDFETMRKVTTEQLRLMGIRNVLTAKNGAEALQLLQRQQVDIVLSDWNMPVMTGLDLLKAVRSDEKLSRLPFIMITSETERSRLAEAVASGVSQLLLKPYTAEGLANRIEKALTAQPRSSSSAIAVPLTNAESVTQTDRETVRSSILVVDDTPDNLQLLSHLFKDDYQVKTALGGEKALSICQSDNPPDLVLLDVMMPGMDGFEVARRMREHPTSETIPVIFVTAMNGEDALRKGLQLGAVDFVTKPIDPEVLKPRVRNFLRYVELHKQVQADYDIMLEVAHLREDVEHVMRHDMKGPLAGLLGLVQTLSADKSMASKHIEQLRLIEDTALQALNLINLSTEIYKIETGSFKLDAKPVLISSILQRTVEMSRATFARKNLIIEIGFPAVDEMPKALGDAMFCYSIFNNLLKNACEAAPEKSRITITLTDETPLRITIQNKGAVPAEIRERFFDKFITQGKQGGSGLGTYSAKLLVEAQNGEISLDTSDQENQTTITVKLPAC